MNAGQPFFRRDLIHFLPFAFVLIYLVFPTANSTGDAMGYAAAQEIGPHHVMYDQLCVWINYLSGFHPIRTLKVMKILNAIAAGSTLFVLMKLLLRIQDLKTATAILLFTGSAFGFMRFATENEAYIFPLLFAVVSLSFTYRYVQTSELRYFWAGLMAITLAVLFHQSYIFWFLAFVFACFPYKTFNFRHIWAVTLSFLLIVFVYVFYAGINHQPLFNWIVQDATEGLVDLKPGTSNFLFTGIGLVRSLFQVHGNILYIVHAYPLLWLFVGISATAIVVGTFRIFRSLKVRKNPQSKIWQRLLLTAFLLQLSFAWFSVGNAEFMVMLPLLGVLIFSSRYQFNSKAMAWFAIGMLIWNLSIAIVPSSLIDFENRVAERKFIEKNSNAVFIAYNKTELENYLNLYHDTGRCVKTLPFTLLKAPGDSGDTAALGKLIRQSIRSGRKVYTDCIDYPQPVNRHSMMLRDGNKDFFSAYWARMRTVDTLSNFYGTVLITEIY